LKEAGLQRGGRGCPIFVAAGNEDSSITYPASSPHAIAVGASTYKEKRASYSNHGNTLSIMAPSGIVIELPFRKPRRGMIFTTDLSYPHRGFNIGSTVAGGTEGVYYNKFTGTSSATPFAAGVAALMLSANPKLSGQEVRSLLQETADKIGPKGGYNAKGHSREYGFGRLNAARAVSEAMKHVSSRRGRKP
jgi:subtilisin family serine protease